jgi:hypothetical protein
MEKPNLVIYGRVIALSDETSVASKVAGRAPMRKRELYLDCTRYDSLTGQRDENENKPLLEFGGDKVMDKLKALELQKDDVVMVRFSIQGNPYKDEKTGRSRVFTAIRCYDIELVRRAGQAAAPQPQPAPAPQPQTQQNDGKQGLPFV